MGRQQEEGEARRQSLKRVGSGRLLGIPVQPKRARGEIAPLAETALHESAQLDERQQVSAAVSLVGMHFILCDWSGPGLVDSCWHGVAVQR